MKKDQIKVAMADDHILLRNALASLINNSGECNVIYECSNGNELIAKLKNGTHPDVIILDLNMPEMDGHQTALFLQKRSFSKLSRRVSEYTNARKVRVSQNHTCNKAQFFAHFFQSTLVKKCEHSGVITATHAHVRRITIPTNAILMMLESFIALKYPCSTHKTTW